MAAADAIKADWPVFGLCDDIRPALATALHGGIPSALVTLYASMGGSPRGLGAQMLVTSDDVTGYLSGGCVEADVVRHAIECLQDGKPRHLVYGRGGPIDIRLPCGGRIDLMVERIAPDEPAAHALAEAGRNAMLWISDGYVRQCLPAVSARSPVPHAGRSRAGLCADERSIYRLHTPQPRFVVVGNDPTALAMALMAQQVGWEVHFIRPKGPAAPPPVPGVTYWRDAPADALSAIGPDPWTAVAVATHQEEDDHDALCAALNAPAGYVGLLGSTRKLPAKRARILAAGVSPERLAALKAPIGLPSGGKSPWEIATGVIAEVGQALHAVGLEQSAPLRSVEAA